MNKVIICCYREEAKTKQYSKEKYSPKPQLRKFWRRPDVSSKTSRSHLPSGLDLGLDQHPHAVCWKDFKSYWPPHDGDASFKVTLESRSNRAEIQEGMI